jgi:formylglycine-generating enzyme required for sulfatase activity
VTNSAISTPAGDLAWIPPQSAVLGSDAHYPEEAPSHAETVDGFWIQRHQVTNADFAAFVEDTGYVTVAERPPDPAAYPAQWCSTARRGPSTCGT